MVLKFPACAVTEKVAGAAVYSTLKGERRRRSGLQEEGRELSYDQPSLRAPPDTQGIVPQSTAPGHLSPAPGLPPRPSPPAAAPGPPAGSPRFPGDDEPTHPLPRQPPDEL